MRDEDWSFFEEDQFKEALAAYENMVRTGISVYLEPDELTDIAEFYMIHNRSKDAMKCIEYALSIHPDAVDPVVFLARQSLFEGDVKKARSICESISKPNDTEVIFLMAEILIREDKKDKAYEYLWGKYQECTESPALFLNDCIDICYDYYLYEKGLEWAEILVRDHPTFADGKMVLADMLVQNKKNDEALAIVDKELDDNPYSIKAWLLEVDALCGKEQYDEALNAVEFALAINPIDERAMLAKAHCLFYLGQKVKAHEQYKAYQELYPADDNGLYLDAMCLISMEKYDDAVQQLEKAIEMDHTRSGLGLQICIQLAFVYSKTKHQKQAIAVLERASEYATYEDKFEKHVLIGNVYLESNQYEEACNEFHVAVEESKDLNATWLSIAISLSEYDYHQDALLILQKLEPLLSNEQHAMASPYMAYSFYCMDRWTDFFRILPYAISENRDTTKYLFSTIFPDIEPESYASYASHMIDKEKHSET